MPFPLAWTLRRTRTFPQPSSPSRNTCAAGSPGFAARDIANQVRPYDQLIGLVRFFQAWDILRFGEDAASTFRSLRQQRVRIGTLDLKIASIALKHGATLPSANARDFSRVPGLRVEHWLGSAA